MKAGDTIAPGRVKQLPKVKIFTYGLNHIPRFLPRADLDIDVRIFYRWPGRKHYEDRADGRHPGLMGLVTMHDDVLKHIRRWKPELMEAIIRAMEEDQEIFVLLIHCNGGRQRCVACAQLRLVWCLPLSLPRRPRALARPRASPCR